jgi:hypothetical protein
MFLFQAVHQFGYLEGLPVNAREQVFFFITVMQGGTL